MRILVWSDAFWPYIGGTEVLVTHLVSALRERGYTVTVVTSHRRPDGFDEAHYRGIPVYRFPFLGALTDASVDRLAEIRQRVGQLKRDFAPDLVHLQMTPISFSAFFHLVTEDIHPAPLLATFHMTADDIAVRDDTLLWHTLRNAAYVTANSEAVLGETRRLAPEITPYSRVIYNGLPVPSLPLEPLPNGTPRVLCLGRVNHGKGFDLALTALASLLDRFPDLHMVIAGDGPARPELERQAVELGLAGRVEFVGWVTPERVPALLNTATVVVMPSRREGFGLVALQAALMARPVVATRVGGLPEVVLHQQTGLLVERDDSHGLAEAIASLLARPAVATRMGQAARQRAQEVFSWKGCVDAYDRLYRQLIKESAQC
jgi:glycogen(starch) synthase